MHVGDLDSKSAINFLCHSGIEQKKAEFLVEHVTGGRLKYLTILASNPGFFFLKKKEKLKIIIENK